MTPEAKSIIQEAGTKVTKSDALKLSRLPPEQQEDAASKLAAGDIRSVDEYQPAPCGTAELGTTGNLALCTPGVGELLPQTRTRTAGAPRTLSS